VPDIEVAVHSSIRDIAADDWDRLAGSEYPFLSHAFLAAAEDTGCVSAATGWQPRHLAIRDGKSLRAAMPLYEKSHSWGEFVFDWAWADAYRRAGLAYYPKLVSAIPFTPAPSKRLLLGDSEDAEASAILVKAALQLATESGCSSMHVLFPLEEEIHAFESGGLKIRKDCQFHWHNRGYRNFDEFLETFSARKRKKARRDRRHVAESGIDYRRLRGTDIDDATWAEVYRLISITFMRRGSMPYFDLDFFLAVTTAQPETILVIGGYRQERLVAAAVFFRGPNALYGRYWGADEFVNALHFETCYYQGIDYCIDEGLALFEPGTQGEHKVSRGFTPQNTWSAHWLGHPEFFAAIGDYLDEEARHVDSYMDAVDERTPFKQDASKQNND
jgi:predicted N-acyltransferase